jgi:hypothetical protein
MKFSNIYRDISLIHFNTFVYLVLWIFFQYITRYADMSTIHLMYDQILIASFPILQPEPTSKKKHCW